jgi:hypothetical protein|tara:strand:+ start:836 stop:1030 length:195 start_codon:yes stop_codon:yes gene_type:complete
MSTVDLIEQRQYAEAVLGGLNIRPFRVDLAEGHLLVPKSRLVVARKLCKHFGWPFEVKALTSNS